MYAYEGGGAGVVPSTRRGLKIDRREMRPSVRVFQRGSAEGGVFPGLCRRCWHNIDVAMMTVKKPIRPSSVRIAAEIVTIEVAHRTNSTA